jgi:hypothetical protein
VIGLCGLCHVWDYSRGMPPREHRPAKEIASGRIFGS